MHRSLHGGKLYETMSPTASEQTTGCGPIDRSSLALPKRQI